MFKNKMIKLFLMLGVILFSFVGIVGCSPSVNNQNNVNASYFGTYFEEDNVERQFDIIYNHLDLVILLKNDIPEKYNDSFFETNSLLVFKIIEPSQGNKSEIGSYIINDKIITINVKTIQVGEDCEMGYWWFILELSKDEIDSFDTVKILKNGDEIINDTKAGILAPQYNYYQSYSFCNIENWPKFIGEEYNLSFGERKYYFILSFSELKNIFETCTGNEITDYFNTDIFDENIVLCVVRDETGGTANIKYSNFKVNGLELSIEEIFIDGGAEVVSKYLDFVVIPKELFPNGELNQGIEYYWE